MRIKQVETLSHCMPLHILSSLRQSQTPLHANSTQVAPFAASYLHSDVNLYPSPLTLRERRLSQRLLVSRNKNALTFLSQSPSQRKSSPLKLSLLFHSPTTPHEPLQPFRGFIQPSRPPNHRQ
jgi:hypothetical protein